MVKQLLALLLITNSTNSCFSQKNNVIENDCPHYYDKILKKEIYTYYTSAPVSPDSVSEGYANYIYRNIKISFDNLIEHTSMRPKYKVVIDEKGKVINCKPLLFNRKEKGILEFTKLDEEVVRIFEESKNWIPAKCNDRDIAIEILIVLATPRLK
jgi:hypothetical protein